MSKISIKYNDIEYQYKSTIDLDSNKHVIPISVAVGDNYDCNDFDIETYDTWISYRRVRNQVDFIIEPNNAQEKSGDRYSNIKIYHKLNRADCFILTINQRFPDYTILLSNSQNGVYKQNINLNFKHLLGKTDDKQTVQTIYAKYTNGEPIVVSVKEYSLSDADSTDYGLVKYDNGLNIERIGNDKFNITSYGKANLYYDFYYVVTIKNKLHRYSEATITINYNRPENEFSYN